MSEQHISAVARKAFGKGAARRLRAADQIPAVIYGHGTDPRHVSLPGHQTMLAVKQANAVLTIDVEGDSVMALVKDIQRDPVKRVIEHVDLVLVRRGEKVTVDIAVHVVGEAALETLVSLDAQTLSLAVDFTSIPENVEVSVEGAVAGTMIHASDLTLPAGAELLSDPETLVVNVTQAMSQEQLDADLEGAEGAEVATAPEGGPGDAEETSAEQSSE